MARACGVVKGGEGSGIGGRVIKVVSKGWGAETYSDRPPENGGKRWGEERLGTNIFNLFRVWEPGRRTAAWVKQTLPARHQQA